MLISKKSLKDSSGIGYKFLKITDVYNSGPDPEMRVTQEDIENFIANNDGIETLHFHLDNARPSDKRLNTNKLSYFRTTLTKCSLRLRLENFSEELYRYILTEWREGIHTLIIQDLPSDECLKLLANSSYQIRFVNKTAKAQYESFGGQNGAISMDDRNAERRDFEERRDSRRYREREYRNSDSRANERERSNSPHRNGRRSDSTDRDRGRSEIRYDGVSDLAHSHSAYDPFTDAFGADAKVGNSAAAAAMEISGMLSSASKNFAAPQFGGGGGGGGSGSAAAPVLGMQAHLASMPSLEPQTPPAAAAGVDEKGSEAADFDDIASVGIPDDHSSDDGDVKMGSPDLSAAEKRKRELEKAQRLASAMNRQLELVTTRIALEEKIESLQAQQRRYNDLKTEHGVLSGKIVDSSRLIAAQQSANNSLNDELAMCDRESGRVQAEITELNARLAQLQSHLQRFNNQKTSTQQMLTQNQTNLNRLISEKSVLDVRMGELNGALDSSDKNLDATIAELSQNLKKTRKDIAKLKNEERALKAASGAAAAGGVSPPSPHLSLPLAANSAAAAGAYGHLKKLSGLSLSEAEAKLAKHTASLSNLDTVKVTDKNREKIASGKADYSSRIKALTQYIGTLRAAEQINSSSAAQHFVRR